MVFKFDLLDEYLSFFLSIQKSVNAGPITKKQDSNAVGMDTMIAIRNAFCMKAN